MGSENSMLEYTKNIRIQIYPNISKIYKDIPHIRWPRRRSVFCTSWYIFVCLGYIWIYLETFGLYIWYLFGILLVYFCVLFAQHTPVYKLTPNVSSRFLYYNYLTHVSNYTNVLIETT